ncbi:hypothetical protein [Streptomyces sp. NPDC090445]|uniref:hypothetical protein n=1 Tax=Streptomyces sp. NPDC090445 TaxID=3365963 RepID=UPI003818603E
MMQTLPPLIADAAALSVAGAGLVRYEVGPALVGAGADATVVIVAPGDHPRVSGVQDSTKVLLRGEMGPALAPRFAFEGAPPLHVFAGLDQGCLPLGTARCRGSSASAPDHLQHAELELDQPLSRPVLDAVRPVPAPGPVPGVEWVDLVPVDPIRALESFVLGWFPAEETATATADSKGTAGEPDGRLPEALTAFHHLARLRPAIHRFHDPVLRRPEHATGPLGDRLVFAEWAGASMDWSIPWPPQGPDAEDPPVWHTEDPRNEDAETIPEKEPLSRFLLQFTLHGALLAAPYHAATYVMPTARLGVLWDALRPVPLSPFLPTYQAVEFYVAPGLLVAVSRDEHEATVSFGALHRGILTPLLEHGFRWIRFDG